MSPAPLRVCFVLALGALTALVNTAFLLMAINNPNGDLTSNLKQWPYITSERSLGVPQVNTQKITMQIEESVHYPLHGPIAEAEWATTIFLPGAGFIRSQKDHKLYLFPMSHQLHCLDYMRTAISNSSAVDWTHLHHCFNFLRQWTLCEADTTLEIGDFVERIHTEARMGSQHICRDWTPIVSALRDNKIEWKSWEKAQKNANM